MGFFAPFKEQESSLFDFSPSVSAKPIGRGLVSSLLGRRTHLFSFAVGDRLLTWGEETEGASFSPGVKKPKAITKGEKEREESFESLFAYFLLFQLLGRSVYYTFLFKIIEKNTNI